MKINLKYNGFTIVEIMVVVVILGILAGMVALSFGNWQVGIAEREVKSDLTNVMTAMKNDLNFKNAFPSGVPSTFTASSGVTVTYDSGSATTYCVNAASKRSPQVRLFVTEAGQIKKGSCIEGEIADYGSASGMASISAHSSHTCSIALSGKAYCWGFNNYGQLGDGTTTQRTSPTEIPMTGALAGKTLKSIVPGSNHTCALASDNQVYCWGWNGYGQLGDGTTTQRTSPVAVVTSGVLAGKTVKSLSSGVYHTCVVASDDKPYCWGRNHQGQLGDGTTTQRTSPVAVVTAGVLAGKTVKSFRLGGDFSCALTSDNQLSCWGDNFYGSLGDGTTTDRTSPVAVLMNGGLAGKTITNYTVGLSYVCVVASDSLAYCWGYNVYGSIGDGTTTNRTSPTAVVMTGVLAGKTIKNIYGGDGYGATTCAIASDSKGYCWGWNQYGQIGDNTTTQRTTPVAVDTSGGLAGKSLKYITASSGHTCTIASDNKAYCWGANNYGQLGDSSTTFRLIPVEVTGQ